MRALGVRGLASVLLVLVVALAALSALLGAPIYGSLLGHDADFAIMSIHLLGDGWAHGTLWPRWLMGANHGLGGATYYTYPPLSHWVAAAVTRGLGVAEDVGVPLTMGLWRLLAVLTTWLWLRRHVPPAAALVGAAIAALLPYASLINPWIRFAFAETAAASLLPLLLLALERAAEGRRTEGLPALACIYAALAMTNLPTCALAAHLGPLYALGYAGWRGFGRSVLGGILGALLAAAFLVPAFGLLRETNPADFHNPWWKENMLGYSAPSPYLLVIWGSGLLMVGLGLGLLRPALGGTPRAGLLAPGLPRALLVLFAASTWLATVLAYPVWVAMPQLAATEHPWRALGHLVPVVAALFALATARRPDRWWVVPLGLALTLMVPAFLFARMHLGNPGWVHFVPFGERLTVAEHHYRGSSWEHLPKAAAAAGWATIHGGGAEPYARPVPPEGTERLTDGFLVHRAAAPFRLPQFYFPAWRAHDAMGPVPLRATPEGWIEVAVDRPVTDLVVEIGITPQERIGYAISLLTLMGLLGVLVQRVRWRPQEAPAPLRSAKG